jgi:hypothetical protein
MVELLSVLCCILHGSAPSSCCHSFGVLRYVLLKAPYYTTYITLRNDKSKQKNFNFKFLILIRYLLSNILRNNTDSEASPMLYDIHHYATKIIKRIINFVLC